MTGVLHVDGDALLAQLPPGNQREGRENGPFSRESESDNDYMDTLRIGGDWHQIFVTDWFLWCTGLFIPATGLIYLLTLREYGLSPGGFPSLEDSAIKLLYCPNFSI